jgi:hypothetical protein
VGAPRALTGGRLPKGNTVEPPSFSPASLESVLSELGGYAQHWPDHTGLLVPFDPSQSSVRADAIIVPSCRGVDFQCSGVALAASLADAHACPLVIVVSSDAATPEGRAHVEGVVAGATGGRVDPVVLDVSSVDALALGLGADKCHLPRDSWVGWRGPADTALKRNLGLLLARRKGWHNVLFLDDDIIALPQAEVAEGLALDARSLGLVMGSLNSRRHRAVGWVAVGHDDASGYADNSVVCRIRRRLGYTQGVFLGGGALAIRVDEWTPHFPRIYDEDWLFCMKLLMRFGRGALAVAGQVTQDPPQSLIDEARAAMEERGDTLAEALMNLMHLMDALDRADPLNHALHADYVVRAADSEVFWTAILRCRRKLVRGLTVLALEQGRPDGSDLMDLAIRSLRAAEGVHDAMAQETTVPVGQYREYVRAWLDDAEGWWMHLDVASAGRLPDSLDHVLPRQPDTLGPGPNDAEVAPLPAARHASAGWSETDNAPSSTSSGSRGELIPAVPA